MRRALQDFIPIRRLSQPLLDRVIFECPSSGSAILSQIFASKNANGKTGASPRAADKKPAT
jgi:hypothetical protein